MSVRQLVNCYECPFIMGAKIRGETGQVFREGEVTFPFSVLFFYPYFPPFLFPFFFNFFSYYFFPFPPFFLALLFLIFLQKFPGGKSLGGTLPPSPCLLRHW